MRLKRIDIKGFKSFAKETTLHFNEKVVGVVGPNGSGKSNIVDAIRWVLGEQKSKELRLDRMSDVLFNGTRKRKAGGLAQVTITFDNHQNIIRSEFQTIGISRLLYRDGTSEYRINNVPCRLKDIHALLQDTGIGSNSYAIIALGMVDDILQDKEHSRRKMFEQAAGIAKYKKRKHETLLKLKSTEGDLDRVEDLLFEIEGNLKTLEKQARRTKRYFTLKENYKEQVIQLAKAKSKHLEYQHQLTKNQITENQDKLRAAEIAVTELEASLAKIKKDNLDQEENVSSLQRDLNDLVNSVRKIESEKSLNQQKINFKNQSIQRIKEYMDSQAKRLKGLKTEIDEKSQLVVEENKTKDQLQEIIDGMMGLKDDVFEQYGSAKDDLDQLTSQFKNQEKRIFELEKQLAISENQKTFHSHQADRLTSDQTSRSQEIDMLARQLKELEGENESFEKSLSKLREDEDTRKEKLRLAIERRDRLQNDLTDLRRQLDSKQNEHDLLKSLVENFEGFPESIQFLNKTSKWERKAPLLTDIIYCSENYRIVLEQYLENYLNYFVVDNTTEAIKAIQLLSDSQKGKANFFILDAIKNSGLSERKIAGAVSIKEFIEVDKKYRILTDMLFHNVFLIEGDIEPYLNNDDYTDCTLLAMDGKLIAQKGNRISGGSIGLFEGKKIGRKKNLDKLTKDIGLLLKQQSDLEDALSKKETEIQALEDKQESDQLDALAESLQNIQKQKVQVETHLNQAQGQLDNLISQLSESDQSVLAISDQETKLRMQLDQEKKSYTEASRLMEAQGEEYEKLLGAYNEENQKFNEARIELVKHENNIQNLQNDLTFSKNQIGEINKELANQSHTLERDEKEIEEASQVVAQQEQDLLGMYDSKKGLEESLSNVEESYFKIRGEIHEIEENLKAKQKQSQQMNFLINELKDQFADSKYKLQTIYDRVRIEFGINPVEVRNMEVEEIDIELDEFQEKVDRLKIRIENFGEINPMALEAYDEMNERYQNIQQQRDDIIEAKRSLLETIKEVENTATTKFLTAFDAVRGYFKEVFRSLFSEDDDCDLLLLNPENPLDSDIEIIAKPKGKRPVTLNQLSGGEKTLTATALLFSMYLLKPAPFCIFDEVDAPLDDANVEKFNRIIKKFSGSSQFIIVTHNKLTMAAMDVIYGVYMEEQGISNVSEVDFRSFDHLSLLEVQN